MLDFFLVDGWDEWPDGRLCAGRWLTGERCAGRWLTGGRVVNGWFIRGHAVSAHGRLVSGLSKVGWIIDKCSNVVGYID